MRDILRNPEDKMGSTCYNNIFSGLIKCADCRYALSSSHDKRRKRLDVIDRVFYQCNQYRIEGMTACTKHTIEARVLHNIILADIQKHAQAAVFNDVKMLSRIIKKLNLNTEKEAVHAKKELAKSRARLNEIDNLFSTLYEDRANEAITEWNYRKLSANYEQEQVKLENRIRELEQGISANREDLSNAELFVQSVKKYVEITELDAALLNRLIDKIIVSEPIISDGERVQEVCIYYKFVGGLR